MDPLRELFRHHAWATLQLIDYCGKLPPAQLQETAPGTYGTIVATLAHLVAADSRYLELMTGDPPERPLREGTEPPLADLRLQFEVQTRRWDALVDRAGTLDVMIAARGPWPPAPHAEGLLFLQAIHHGNDHRTHVGTVLGSLGLEGPQIDGWSYWFSTRS